MRMLLVGCVILLVPSFLACAGEINQTPPSPNASEESSSNALDEDSPSLNINNIVTTLSVERTWVRIGEPITVSLNATNIGNREIEFYWTDNEGVGFSIDAVDGHEVRYVGGLRPPQPPPLITIQPGCTTTLRVSDLTEEFLVSIPGQYTVCSRSNPQHRSVPMPSNEVTVTVESGELIKVDKVLSLVLPMLPDGWTILTRSRHESKSVIPVGRKEVGGCWVSLFGEGFWLSRGKSQRVIIWQTDIPAEPDQNYDYRNNHFFDGSSEFIGKSKYGYLYVLAVVGPTDLKYCWPDPIASLKSVLMQE